MGQIKRAEKFRETGNKQPADEDPAAKDWTKILARQLEEWERIEQKRKEKERK